MFDNLFVICFWDATEQEVPVRIPRGVTLVGGEQLHPHRQAEDHENPDGGASSTRKRHQTGRDW